MIKMFTLIVLFIIVSACTRFIPPPSVIEGPPLSPDEAWTHVLQRAVDDQGRVNFALMAKDRKDLETYVAYVANVSPRSHPELFPSRSDQFAYYINSYNALAMYGVIAHGHIPEPINTFPKRVRFFKLTKYKIGGENISLYDYENDIIRPLGEPRVHFGLNCMAAGCPRLPNVPFKGKELDQQLEEAAVEFFNSEKYVQVDRERRVVYLSEILRFYTKDFVNEKVVPSLVAYANKYRKEKIPEDFAVRFIPYDWTIYKQ